MYRLGLYAVTMFFLWLTLTQVISIIAPYVAAALLFVCLCLLLSKGKKKKRG